MGTGAIKRMSFQKPKDAMVMILFRGRREHSSMMCGTQRTFELIRIIWPWPNRLFEPDSARPRLRRSRSVAFSLDRSSHGAGCLSSPNGDRSGRKERLRGSWRRFDRSCCRGLGGLPGDAKPRLDESSFVGVSQNWIRTPGGCFFFLWFPLKTIR